MKFRVNDKAPGTVIHQGGRQYRKGVVYDSDVERIPPRRLKKMMELKIHSLRFFVEVKENNISNTAKASTADDNAR